MKKTHVLFNVLHAFNDGFEASFLLLLPFIAKDLHINLAQVGILGTINNAVEIFVAFPAGVLAAKYGGLKTVVLGLFIYSIGYLLTGFSPSFFLLFGTFFLAGIGFGSFHSIALAVISRESEKEKRGKTIGNFMAIGDIGRIGISTILTFFVVFFGWRYTAIGYAIAGFVLFLFLYRMATKNFDKNSKEKVPEVHIPTLHFFKNKKFIFANLSNFFDSFASSSLFMFLPFLLLKRGINPAILGVFTAAFFIGNLLGKTLIGRLADVYTHTKMFIISEICMAVFIIILANTPSFYIIMIAAIILGIFTKGTSPLNKAMVSEAIEHQGNFEKAFGINGVIASTAVTIAPLVLGLISNTFGIVSAFNLSAIFALCAIIPALFFHFAKKPPAYKPIKLCEEVST